MKTLVLCNQKGGVGKSAVATLLTHYLAVKGRRVLAVDLDHQGNLTAPLQRSGRIKTADFAADAVMTGKLAELPAARQVLIGSGPGLLSLERQPDLHTSFARNFRSLLARAESSFDVCIVDTNPNPDIRLVAALASADFALSPIQLNQEAMDGVAGLLNHQRVGLRKIKTVLNPKLALVGLLPTMVEPTPYQKANFVTVVQRHHTLMIRIGEEAGAFASIPRRSCIAEAQADGALLWEMKKTAARDAWTEIEPSLARIAEIVTAPGNKEEMGHAAAS